ncbi:hypothetical protein EVAR_18272_1 [Eumeta japonica]|uniref:Uncharacterized protein n=1 Tax=Eumeta variegata TaxID=151549 RepID=A0A4C1UJN3_EUMVA|nr:hypothetical protein EVAR_18272_1 [Eumeta japonica]
MVWEGEVERKQTEAVLPSRNLSIARLGPQAPHAGPVLSGAADSRHLRGLCDGGVLDTERVIEINSSRNSLVNCPWPRSNRMPTRRKPSLLTNGAAGELRIFGTESESKAEPGLKPKGETTSGDSVIDRNRKRRNSLDVHAGGAAGKR